MKTSLVEQPISLEELAAFEAKLEANGLQFDYLDGEMRQMHAGKAFPPAAVRYILKEDYYDYVLHYLQFAEFIEMPTPIHNTLLSRFHGESYPLLKEAGFNIYSQGPKVLVGRPKWEGAGGSYRIPDVTVAKKQEEEWDEQGCLLNPWVIAEVASPSTREVDFGAKREEYGQIESLREYLILEQDSPRITCLRRTEGGWSEEVLEGIGAVYQSAAIPQLALPLAVLYEGV